MVETVRWLRKPGTAALFKNQVIEPAILSLEIRDPHFAAPIESCFSYNLQRVCFPVCVAITANEIGLFGRRLS